MQKTLFNVLLIIFLGLSIYYYFEAKTAKTLLAEKTVYFEKTIEDSNQKCEARLARLKIDYEKNLSGQPRPSQGESLSSFIDAIKERKQQSRDKIFAEVISSLELDEAEVKGFMSSMEFFEDKKKFLMNEVRSQGGNIFDPRNAEHVNECREQTLILIQKAIPEDKFKTFMEFDFDQKLDLRKR